jgi:lantibiotic modifying enzyme
MRLLSAKWRSAQDGAGHRETLVLGYQGTLIPDPDRSALGTAGTDEVHWIAAFQLESWLERASRELDRRVSADQRECGGERIDTGACSDALRERLIGMMTQVMAASPAQTGEQVAHRFPVLSTLMQRAVVEWVEAIALFHQRLHSDAARLAEWLGYERLPSLASLTPAGSDLHDGAHTVMRLVFPDRRCVYYKPRPVTGEWLWNGLVRAVNAHSSLQLPSACVLAGANGRYGWVASLPLHAQLHSWDKDSNEASRYWQAAGATLCLAEHVRMTDLHMANVMATGSGPALFDAESLGTPRAVSDREAMRVAEQPIATAIQDLLDTGLLPGPELAGRPDTSGLFGKAAPVPHLQIPHWSAGPERGQHFEMVPAALADHGNAPPCTTPMEVLSLLVSGYREAATALMRCRESLLAPGSAWLWMLEQQHAPRIILRDTLTYSILLSRSLQAILLQRAQLRKTTIESALRGLISRVLPQAILQTEARALLSLHIPHFMARPGSRTLASNSGRALAQRFLSCSPAEAVLRKMGELSEDHVNEELIPGLLLTVFGRIS